MRRIYVLPLILLLSLTVMVAMAQEDPPPDTPTPFPTVVPDEPQDDQQNSTDFMDLNAGPLIMTAGEGSDFCGSATEITSLPGSNQMDVASMTQTPSDPILNCMWGSPSSSRGYRTVWYKYEPDFNGIMQVGTLPGSAQGTNAYDTVLAVHTGSCGALTTLACNDDFVGFSSQATVAIRRNTTYYIEVADWQAGGNATKLLNLSVKLIPYTSLWKDVTTSSFTNTSRQASIVVGSNIYLLGGRSGAGSLLNNFQRLNTNTGTWTPLSPIPGGGFLDTTAVYLSDTNSVYIPGGNTLVGGQAYSSDHRYYDFDDSVWHLADEPVGGIITETEKFAYAAAAPNNAAMGIGGGEHGYFLTGGIVGPALVPTSTVRSQVLFYQPSSDTWLERKEMSSPRYGHVAANVGGELCVAGGLNADGVSNVLITDSECASGVSPSGPSAWTPSDNDMHVPRFFAHSSVGPDGKWYVYGGVDARLSPVPEVEFYDPDTNKWSLLGLPYDLYGQPGQPGVTWPGGGFVGNYLWAAGGSFDADGEVPNTLVKKVQIIGGNSLYLPIVLTSSDTNNHSFADARYLNLGQTVSQNFSSTPFVNYNVYKFSINQVSTIRAQLTGVASTANLNLYIYGTNKDLLQSNVLPFVGIDKTITMALAPGTYYVVVKYNSSTNYPNDISDYYQLRISKQ